MNTPRKIKEKITQLINSSYSTISSLISKSEINNDISEMSDNISDYSILELSTDKPVSHSKNKFIISKSHYNSLQNEISELSKITENKSKKEEEYKKLLLDFENTINYVTEKTDGKEISVLENIVSEKLQTIEELRTELKNCENYQKNLKRQIRVLEKDLRRSEERANAYMEIAQEKIEEEKKRGNEIVDEKNKEIDKIKEENEKVNKKLEKRNLEVVELIEYLKIVINETKKR